MVRILRSMLCVLLLTAGCQALFVGVLGAGEWQTVLQPLLYRWMVGAPLIGVGIAVFPSLYITRKRAGTLEDQNTR